MNRIVWAAKEFEWLGRRLIHSVTGSYHVNYSKYAGVGIVSDETANERIYKGLIGDKPFAVGKTGFSEIGYMCCAQNERYFNSKIHYYWTPSYIRGIDKYFKKNRDIQRFYDITYESMNSLDAIGTYAGMFMCDAVLQLLTNVKDIMIFDLGALNGAYGSAVTWSRALEDKRILVVSPFCNEIKIQYEKRELLWPDGRLPRCQLEYDPSIWVRDNGYFDSLDILSERVLAREFDIALLACGSVGLPLAARIKENGKKAIHMGSALNNLFGLKTKRWDGGKKYNEYWIRPGDETKPSHSDDIDGATYW